MTKIMRTHKTTFTQGTKVDARKKIERLKRSLTQAEKRAKRAGKLLEFQKQFQS